jgi:hypothetical protein
LLRKHLREVFQKKRVNGKSWCARGVALSTLAPAVILLLMPQVLKCPCAEGTVLTRLGARSPPFSQSTSPSEDSFDSTGNLDFSFSLHFEYPTINSTGKMDAAMGILKSPTRPLMRWRNCSDTSANLSSNFVNQDKPDPHHVEGNNCVFGREDVE